MTPEDVKKEIEIQEEFEHLLAEFKKLPPLKKHEPTLMEISGYPHYENVCSNILAFFFSSNEDHGLKTLLLESLLAAAKIDITNIHISYSSAECEVPTKNNKRIDIVITTDNAVIGIENKIYADIYNDLIDYQNCISELASKDDKSNKILILLSFKQITNDMIKNYSCLDNNGKFYSITYSDLFEKINEKIGDFILNSNNKYLTYLIDFMKTINNLKRGTTMDPNLLAFFQKHEHENKNENALFKLLKAGDDLRKEMRNQIKQLKDSIKFNIAGIYIDRGINPTGISEYLLICDFIPNDASLFKELTDKDRNLAISTTISPSGWEISMYFYYLRDKDNLEKLKTFLSEIGIATNEKNEDSKLVCEVNKELKYEASIKDVSKCLQEEVLDKIKDHIINC
jgi:hypothetical protein